MTIDNIYDYKYFRDEIGYAGSLRNERVFNIRDTVYFVLLNPYRIFKTDIIGVELPPAENPEYIYKIRLPKEVAANHKGELFKIVTCACLFGTLQEAKQSAIDNLNHRYELQQREIENYFTDEK